MGRTAVAHEQCFHAKGDVTITEPSITSATDWPDAPWLEGRLVNLVPLRVQHARELAPLLGDARLHTFIGGAPASLPELEARYRRQVRGYSPGGTERWLNWVVRRQRGEAVGTVQATIRPAGEDVVAEVAWVIGSLHQGHGYARDAAQAMVNWLRHQGADRIIAHIHPDHGASSAVARAAGLRPTSVIVEGEVRWQ